MKRKRLRFFIPVLFLFFIYACGEKQAAPDEASAKVPAVKVLEVSQDSITGYSNYPAVLEGIVSSSVRAKVSGYILDVLVDEGQRVKEGQPLFKLETETLDEDLQAARALVSAAEVEVEKLKPLVEQDIISSVQLETAKANLARSKSNYNSIAARIGYATVKSPVDGYVGSINFREGTLVSPSDPQPLTSVSNTEKIFAFFSLNETEYLDFLEASDGRSLEERIEYFPKVLLELANGSVYEHKGTIQTVSGQVNPESGTISVRAVFPNPDRLLSDGNSGTVLIPHTYTDYLLVPERSVYDMQGELFAYKVAEDNTIGAVRLEYVDNVDNQYVVSSGLKPGDRIVAEGAGRLKANQKIDPQIVPYDSISKPIKPIFN